MNNLSEYLEKIRISVTEIPKHNLLFFGCWVLDNLMLTCQTKLNLCLPSKDTILLKEILNYLWKCIDNELVVDKNKINTFYIKLSHINESNLDRTNVEEAAIYELIVGLDSLLMFCTNNIAGFEFNLAQSMINVIDTQLKGLGIDITTNEGFNNHFLHQEIHAQLNIITLSKSNKLNSHFKHAYRLNTKINPIPI
ncbi:hypothetical protein VQ643_11090 [Pseudomonas sp. F1_0610]|uniref:hypothetical protein n=1 Tax=Pseudomonas sp. F1_0610 TaxID=3114284 RepID=UPI0039C455C8